MKTRLRALLTVLNHPLLKLMALGRVDYIKAKSTILTFLLRLLARYWWLVAIIITLIVGSWLSWCYWHQLHKPEDSVSTTLRNQTIIIAAILALVIAVWRGLVATEHTRIAQRSFNNDRIQRAAEMLGHPSLAVRLGGIEAMHALFTEQPAYYVQCMRVLAAFVRHPLNDDSLPKLTRRQRTTFGGGSKLRADVQAILTMLRSRNRAWIQLEKEGEYVIDFSGADLCGAILSGVNLAGVNLSSADLSGAYAREANMSGAYLYDAILYKTMLAGAILRGTNFSGADLTRTWFCQVALPDKFDDDGIRRFTVPAIGVTGFGLWRATAKPNNPPIFGDVVIYEESGTKVKWP